MPHGRVNDQLPCGPVLSNQVTLHPTRWDTTPSAKTVTAATGTTPTIKRRHDQQPAGESGVLHPGGYLARVNRVPAATPLPHMLYPPEQDCPIDAGWAALLQRRFGWFDVQFWEVPLCVGGFGENAHRERC